MVNSYSTQQRKLLLAFFKENPDRYFSVEEIAERLCEEKSISVSAIYRNVNSMVKDGNVRRFSVDGRRRAVYQYIGDECSRHIHLKCDGCGRIFHMEAGAMEKILIETMDNNEFSIDVSRTTLYGSCKGCQ